MNSLNRSKINQLLRKIPQGSVAVQSWLEKNGIYRQLTDTYSKSGWLKKIGRGAFAKLDDEISWTGGLYAIQTQMHLPIHVGGKVALERQGFAHFLPLGKKRKIVLFGSPSSKLPKWFQQYHWKEDIHLATPKLFKKNTTIGLTKENIDDYSIVISSPERAMMETLYFVPKNESFEDAKLLMEGLTTLRPELVQKLLERCESIKIIRLFLFLAGEAEHEWMKKIDTKHINWGKGKRVIVKEGRLDPIYHITVPKEPFKNLQRQIEELKNKRNKSPAIRLMLSEKIKQLSYGKNDAYYASIVYLASESGYLPILDQLFKEFKIEKRGATQFKGDLKETWLNLVPDRSLLDIRKGSNNTFSCLIELLTAQYLREKDCKILDLQAWNKDAPDIFYRDKNQGWNAEVKYIPPSPEWQAIINNQLKTGESKPRRFDDGGFVNYYFGRIAEAVKQLESYPYKTRQVWFVFNTLVNFERQIFEKNYLKHPPDWFQNTEEQKHILKMISKTVGEDISKKSPKEWLKKIPEVILATCDSWSLKKINLYKTKELICNG